MKIILKLMNGPYKGSNYVLADGEKRTIGRGSKAGIVLDDKLASRIHCEVLNESGIVQVRDLGSSNGTYLNEKLIQKATLYSGDRFKVGGAIFELRGTVSNKSEQSDETKQVESVGMPTGQKQHGQEVSSLDPDETLPAITGPLSDFEKKSSRDALKVPIRVIDPEEQDLITTNMPLTMSNEDSIPTQDFSTIESNLIQDLEALQPIDSLEVNEKIQKKQGPLHNSYSLEEVTIDPDPAENDDIRMLSDAEKLTSEIQMMGASKKVKANSRDTNDSVNENKSTSKPEKQSQGDMLSGIDPLKFEADTNVPSNKSEESQSVKIPDPESKSSPIESDNNLSDSDAELSIVSPDMMDFGSIKLDNDARISPNNNDTEAVLEGHSSIEEQVSETKPEEDLSESESKDDTSIVIQDEMLFNLFQPKSNGPVPSINSGKEAEVEAQTDNKDEDLEDQFEDDLSDSDADLAIVSPGLIGGNPFGRKMEKEKPIEAENHGAENKIEETSQEDEDEDENVDLSESDADLAVASLGDMFQDTGSPVDSEPKVQDKSEEKESEPPVLAEDQNVLTENDANATSTNSSTLDAPSSHLDGPSETQNEDEFLNIEETISEISNTKNENNLPSAPTSSPEHSIHLKPRPISNPATLEPVPGFLDTLAIYNCTLCGSPIDLDDIISARARFRDEEYECPDCVKTGNGSSSGAAICPSFEFTNLKPMNIEPLDKEVLEGAIDVD